MPTVKAPAPTLAVLVIVSCGATTGVGPTVLVQRLAAGQLLSPPPLTVAVLVTDVPLMLACGVTGITKLVLLPAARPAATVQVTVWPAAVQPAGSVPSVRPVGIGSLTVAAAVVALVPVLDTCSV